MTIDPMLIILILAIIALIASLVWFFGFSDGVYRKQEEKQINRDLHLSGKSGIKIPEKK